MSTEERDPVLDYDVEASTTVDIAQPPLTKAQFVRKINGICREAWSIVYENWETYTGNQDRGMSRRARFDEAVRASLIAGIVFHIFDNFVILGAPASETQDVEAIIGPFQAAAELSWKERWRAYSAEEIPPHFAIYNRRAQRYGFNDCLVDEEHLRPIVVD